MKHVLCILALWAAGLGSALLANNIAVSNVTTTGQNTSAGVNNAANYTDVKFDLSWENSWRHNSTSGGLSYIALKTRGSSYTGTPNVFIGSQGSVAWQASTVVTAGSFLVVSGTPNRYYRVTSNHTTGATAPTHTTGTTANLEFVSVSDGGGSGATATASVSSGFITGFTITAAGSGYTSLPSIHIFPTNGGSGATADVHISSWWDAAWVFVKFRVGVSNPVLTGASSSGTTVTVSSTANLRAGMPVFKNSGTGTFATNTVISSISSATTFVVSATPTVALNNATITCRRIWEHASLNTTQANHTAPAGSTVDVPSDGVGAFIYRSANGTGSFNLSGVQLRWEYGSNGVTDDAVLQVQVFALEMVWVPQGEFAAGDGSNGFTLTTINTATASTLPSGVGNLGGAAGGYPTGQTAPNASWPNGYNGFYCMKYEVTQGDYRDFLNTLTYIQQTSRAVSVTGGAGTGALALSNQYRNGLDIQTPGVAASFTPAVYACNLDGDGNYNETDDGEWIACNFLSWMDGCAYVDWAGLRPMTELEYEKACRGDQAAVSGEYAWGDAVITGATGISNSGANNETFSNAGANCAYGNNAGVQGPLRVGAFAGGATTRAQSGGSYYGIMELSGNLWERTVTIGHATGRAFTGLNGNGRLSANGHANQSLWPGIVGGEVTGATGSGFRGGAWVSAASLARVSARNNAALTYTLRRSADGFRGVRVFP